MQLSLTCCSVFSQSLSLVSTVVPALLDGVSASTTAVYSLLPVVPVFPVFLPRWLFDLLKNVFVLLVFASSAAAQLDCNSLMF